MNMFTGKKKGGLVTHGDYYNIENCWKTMIGKRYNRVINELIIPLQK